MNSERQSAREAQKAKLNQKGEGLYIFENNTKGDLFLPRPTHTGRRFIPKGQQFLGDNYYFSMIPRELKLIKEVSPPQEKLITEQPPTVTNTGPVEYVKSPLPDLNEENGTGQVDVLLTESPLDGIKVMK